MITSGINNQSERLAWLKTKLQALSAGFTLPEAGAGELRNKVWWAMLMLCMMRLIKAGNRGVVTTCSPSGGRSLPADPDSGRK